MHDTQIVDRNKEEKVEKNIRKGIQEHRSTSVTKIM